MPFQLLLNLNQAAPSVTVQFTDADNHVINTPLGAQVEFSSDNTDALSIAPDSNNGLKGDITLAAPDSLSSQISNLIANVKISVTGANDADGQPFKDQIVHTEIIPPIPAMPASIVIRIEQAE